MNEDSGERSTIPPAMKNLRDGQAPEPGAPDLEVQAQDLIGKRLYSPGAIVAATVVSCIPGGLFLWAINLRRRGARRSAGIVLGFAVVTLALFVAAWAMVNLFIPLAVLVAIVIYNLEIKPYRKALERGAVQARSWPPIVIILGILFLAWLWVVLSSPSSRIPKPRV